MDNNSERPTLRDISLIARATANVLDSAIPEELDIMTDITLVCTQALKQIAERSKLPTTSDYKI